MLQVSYEQYIQHIGFAAYIYKHDYTDGHNTDVINLNGAIVARIERNNGDIKYFIQG